MARHRHVIHAKCYHNPLTHVQSDGPIEIRGGRSHVGTGLRAYACVSMHVSPTRRVFARLIFLSQPTRRRRPQCGLHGHSRLSSVPQQMQHQPHLASCGTVADCIGTWPRGAPVSKLTGDHNAGHRLTTLRTTWPTAGAAELCGAKHGPAQDGRHHSQASHFHSRQEPSRCCGAITMRRSNGTTGWTTGRLALRRVLASSACAARAAWGAFAPTPPPLWQPCRKWGSGRGSPPACMGYVLTVHTAHSTQSIAC